MIEIVLATYNGEHYLTEQLESVLQQSYQEFQILIRDDGSTDNTVNIIKSYVEQYPEKIRLIESNTTAGGAANNFFQLMNYATAEYVMFCDQDDVWLPNKIEVMYQTMLQLEKEHGNQTPILVFSDYRLVDKDLKELDFDSRNNQISEYRLDLNHLLVQNYVTGCTVMINKKLCQRVGLYDEVIQMHDWWVAIMASAMGVIYHLPQPLMLYRQHGNNCVGAVNIKSFHYRIHKFLDKKTKLSQQKYVAQAKCFYQRYESFLEQKEKKILQDFIQLWNNKSKWRRMKLLLQGKYLKSDFVRILGQLWYV